MKKLIHAMNTTDSVIEQRETLLELKKVASQESKRNIDGIIGAITEALLFNGYEQEVYDHTVLSDYLKTPLYRHSQFIKEFTDRISFQSRSWMDLIKYRPIGIPQPSHEVVVEAYLNHCVQLELDLVKNYSQYFNGHFLTGIILRNQVLNGGALDQFKTHFGEYAATELENKKDLTILRRNKRRVTHGEEVSLTLEVKNIAELTYKVFEIDTEAYYKLNKAELKDSLDLDGLIPNQIKLFTYGQKKHHRHFEQFDFPEIQNKQRGVFIVEFVGGGMSSRAVLKKGSLTPLISPHSQGYQVFIVDEAKKVVKGKKTGLIIDNKFHAVREDGAYVLLPFNETTINPQVIVTHEGFSSLATLSMPSESYTLQSEILFNEESIVNGRKLKIVLQNRLFLNGSPITLAKVNEANVELELTNYDGITNFKSFKDIKLVDTDDHCIELIVPPMLTRLSVSLNMKVKNLIGTEINLGKRENITISRDENSDRFITCHLDRSPQLGYFVLLRGKNGEAIPNRQVMIQLFKSFGNFNFMKELYTDKAGRAVLGNLEEIRYIIVTSNNGAFLARTFAIDSPLNKINIASNYNICHGEQLALPSLGLELSKNNFELLWRSSVDGSLLRDSFDQIAFEKETGLLVFPNLDFGLYTFNYLTVPPLQVSIIVHQAQRWDSSDQYINLKKDLLAVTTELKYLAVNHIEQSKESISFKVASNKMKTCRVHLLGFHNHSGFKTLIRSNTEKLTPVVSQKTTQIKDFRNSFLSNRVLSDEHVYINERKNKTTFIGNTLDKPSILLHREKVRETTDNEENLQTGAAFQNDDFVANSRTAAYDMMGGLPSSKTSSVNVSLPNSYNIINNLDFLEDSGKIVANLKPAEDGSVNLPVSEWSSYSHLLVVIRDGSGSVSFDINIGESSVKKQDLRVPKAKEAGMIYTEEFFPTAVPKAQQTEITDMNNTSTYMVEDLNSALDVLLVIAGSGVNKTEIGKWRFLVSWNKLSDEEKFKKFEEFGGHELNLFAYLRDRSFFDAHIKPMLRCKAKKELIDYLLTDDVENYQKMLSAENFAKINFAEGILLVLKLKDSQNALCQDYLESLRKKLDVQLESNEKKKALYESILASKKIEDAKPAPKPMPVQQNIQMEMCMAPMMSRSMAAPAPGMMLKKKVMAPRKMMEESKCDKMDLCMDDMECEEALPSQPIVVEKYQKKGAAFEFKERQEYFKGQFKALQLSKFWAAVIDSILNRNSPLVLGEELINMVNSSLEVVLALTFLDLPFVRGSVDSKVVESSLWLQCSENALLFCKRMKEKRTDPLNMELVISQKFYDPVDKFVYDEKDPSVYTIKEVAEYLTGKIYEGRVAFTNIGESSCSVQLISQIPQGALPVNKLQFYKIHDVSVSSMSTQVLSFKFYFPSCGSFGYYPATIMKSNRFVVSAKYQGELKVVEEYSKENKVLETLQDILNYGTIDDILNFMQQKNIYNDKIFDLNKVKWIFKSSKQHFEAGLKILRAKYMFREDVWAYSVYHGCLPEFLELLKIKLGQQLSASFFKVRDIVHDTFEPLEYDPLINPRAHDISDKKHNILNKTFKETYERFLKYCVEKGALDEREKIILTSYLILQDRIQDALVHVKAINEQKVLESNTMVVQYEYIKAYLSIYTDQPEYAIARAAATKYRDFPDLSWRKRFREIEKQLKEYDQGKLEKEALDKTNAVQKKSNKELADRSEYLALELREGFNIAITHKNVSKLSISFYKLDMEILFSNDPFLEKEIFNFVSVNPNHLLKFKLNKSSDFKTNLVQIPEALQKDSLFIQVKGKDKFEIIKSFNSLLKAHPIEDFGLLNVTDQKGKCLNSVYVKCFSKTTAGVVKFYKDGYTDFRGSYDYASLNSDSLNNIEKFGLYVYSKEHGSVILTAKPPSQVGRIVKEDQETGEMIAEDDDSEDLEGAIALE